MSVQLPWSPKSLWFYLGASFMERDEFYEIQIQAIVLMFALRWYRVPVVHQ